MRWHHQHAGIHCLLAFLWLFLNAAGLEQATNSGVQAELILESVSLQDVGKITPLWHVSFRILDLEDVRDPNQTLCKLLRVRIAAFLYSWDNPRARPGIGQVTLETPQICQRCNTEDPLDVKCRFEIPFQCGADGLEVHVERVKTKTTEQISLTQWEDAITDSVTCDEIHLARIAKAQAAAFSNSSLTFGPLAARPPARAHVVRAGDELALDYVLRGDRAALAVKAGSALQLLVNGAQYAFDHAGDDALRYENPFWTTAPHTILVSLPAGQHELELRIWQPGVQGAVLQSEVVEVDLQQRKDTLAHADAGPESCRLSLLCRTLLELTDLLDAAAIPFVLHKYTALGFYAFGWFIPSRSFVPLGLTIPWQRTLHVAVAARDDEALVQHLKKATVWRISRRGRLLVAKHAHWKVTVESTLLPDSAEQGELSCGGGRGQACARRQDSCSAAEASRSSAAVRIDGRELRLPEGVEGYLLGEEWRDYAEGSLSIPLQLPWTRRLLQAAEERLWQAWKTAEHEAVPADDHIFSLLSAWKGKRHLSGPARHLQQWHSSACRSLFAQRQQQPPQLEVDPALRPWGSRDVGKVRVREDLHAEGRAGATDMFGHEVYISHEYKFVWVRVLKAASRTTREFLVAHFGMPRQKVSNAPVQRDWSAGGELVPQYCYVDLPNAQQQGAADVLAAPHGQQCLSRQLLADYFFFAFVRHPLSRFQSSLAQAQRRENGRRRRRGEAERRLNATEVLQSMLETSHMLDFHLETQAHALASNVVLSHPPDTTALPLDFIGRVEAYEEDWKVLLRLLERHAGRPLPPIDWTMLRRAANKSGDGKRKVMAGLDEEAVEALVREVYAQDLACFA